MIFSVFCCASARWGKRKPVVSPAAAAALPVILTNFLRVSFFDMGLSPFVRVEFNGEDETTKQRDHTPETRGRGGGTPPIRPAGRRRYAERTPTSRAARARRT